MADHSEQLKLGKGSVFVKSRLKRLQQEDETWEADFRALPKPVGQSVTEYFGMVATQPECFHLADLHVEGRPSVNDLAKLLSAAMRRPLVGRAHRPSRILLRKHPQWQESFPHLKGIGIEVSVEDELPMIKNAFEDYLRQVHDGRSEGASDPSSEQETVEKLFPAVAKWINDGYGHVEIGDQEGVGFIVSAIEYGGVVHEDETPQSLTEAMASLETALAHWFREEGIPVEQPE